MRETKFGYEIVKFYSSEVYNCNEWRSGSGPYLCVVSGPVHCSCSLCSAK